MSEALHIADGLCHVVLAHDVGYAINLDHAERLIRAVTQREVLKHRRRAPRWFQYHPAPLRVTEAIQPVTVAGFASRPSVDVTAFDFGSVSVSYAFPLRGSLASVLDLSRALYDDEPLLADSRNRVQVLLDAIHPAVARPSLTPFVEDYAMFEVRALEGGVPTCEPLRSHRPELARLLRAEDQPLSDDEVNDALSVRISYGPDDAAVVDWNAALLLGADADDVRTVLEFANVELLEMRFLDSKLDAALEDAYAVLLRRRRLRAFSPSYRVDMQRIARLQADSAVLFEGVHNALKLLGDPYLARVYRLASQRFHLPQWDAAILRKLQSLDSIYGKLSDESAARRMELLEWIIIALIFVSILLPFIWQGKG